MMKYRHILNMASVSGLLSYGLFLLYFYVLSTNPLGPIKYVTFIAVTAILYMSLKNYRETELEGFATFRQIFLAGVMFSFIYASLTGMLVYLHGIAIDGSYVEFIVNETLQSIGEYKDTMVGFLGKDQYQEVIDQYQDMAPADFALGDFQSKSLSSLLLALIYSFILRKSPPVFTESEQ